MNVLITGSDGYIGSVLVHVLRREGIPVFGVDAGFYRQGLLYTPPWDAPQTLTRDIRHLEPENLTGFQAIVHLAELSNDPTGENDPAITHEINHRGSVRLAELAKAAGVQRFIYTSSCSVYGAAGDDDKTETSAVNPQTAYARCKVLVEQDVSALASDRFTPVFLRNATAFGASPRMRFDIVLNDLCALAWVEREIRMKSDGTPWRPLVHVRDICEAIRLCLTADRKAIHNEIFNVGSNAQNYRIREVAETVASVFPGCGITFGDSGGDTRSYRVNFDKITQHLGFDCAWDARTGARELAAIFERIDFCREMYDAPPFTRLAQLKYLLSTGQLDEKLFWTEFADFAGNPESFSQTFAAARGTVEPDAKLGY